MNLDAYTVRKLAPKLLIAIVAVNISIYLCVAAIDITNIFGRGINQLISAPFMQAADRKFELDTLQGADDTLVFFGVLIAVGMLVTLSLAGGQLLPMIALVLLPVVLAVLAVLVTLVVRKALLVLLTIVSPVAFALWVLPGTDKYFKQWWSLFLKTLMVYPIIAALFAITNIMAVVTFDSSQISQEEVIAAGVEFDPDQPPADPGQAGGAGQGDGFGANALNSIIGIILVFIPLFMVPFAFKFAGGAIGALSGRLSELQKPFSRMAGRERQKRFNSNVGKAAAGNLIKQRGRGRASASDYKRFGKLRAPMSRGLNKATTGANAVSAGLANLPNDRGGLRPRNIKERMRRQQFAHVMEFNKEDKDWARLKPENDTMGGILQAKSGSRQDLAEGLRSYVRSNGNKTRKEADAAESSYFDGPGGELNAHGRDTVSRMQEQHSRMGGDFESLQLAALIGGSESAPMWKDQYGEKEDGSWGRISSAAGAQNKAAAKLSGGGRISDRNQLVTTLNEANGAARRPDLITSATKKAQAIDAWADEAEGRPIMGGVRNDDGTYKTAQDVQDSMEGSMLTHKQVAELVSGHPEGAKIAADYIGSELEVARASGNRDRELELLATAEGALTTIGPGNLEAKRAFDTLLSQENADGVSNQDQMSSLQRLMPLEESIKETYQVAPGVTRERIVKQPLDPAERARREALNADAKKFARMVKIYGFGGDAEAAGVADKAARPPDQQ